jgi:hypothetical protein
MKRLAITAAALLFLAALSLAGKWDSDVAAMSEKAYCERVALKVHTHFNKDIDCNDANEGENDEG